MIQKIAAVLVLAAGLILLSLAVRHYRRNSAIVADPDRPGTPDQFDADFAQVIARKEDLDLLDEMHLSEESRQWMRKQILAGRSLADLYGENRGRGDL